MRTPLVTILASTVFVALLVGLLIFFNVDRQLLELLRWIERQGFWSGFWFILIMAVATVLLLPGLLFTTGAGFVFGVTSGTVYVVVGTTLGATLAFLIARYVLGESGRRLLLRHATLHNVTKQMRQHDLRVVMLTRLIPFFPGKLSNYFFGITGFSLKGFLFGTFFGLIPFSLHNVYLGSLAASLSNLNTREAPRSPLEWSIYLIGFLATVAAVWYLNQLARRSLAGFSSDDTTISSDDTTVSFDDSKETDS
ncbi:MAG: TVP38/TMEM64 family protein [Gammaproteobacteria bacterium]|nr:TVP38/TMEM64 family protein [Pseudomonadales bacterium]MCP5347331.1 TVP38/TMEM64 family protein [Pseudomonadales bacterium]